MVIAFMFNGLRKEGRIKDDLDTIYHVLADDFRLIVDNEVIFREVDFPVIELASALHSWVRGGASRGELAFVPSGYDTPAFRFLSANGDWSIASSQRVDKRWDVKTSRLEISIKRYLEDTTTACSFLGVDLTALLSRMHKYAGQHVE